MSIEQEGYRTLFKLAGLGVMCWLAINLLLVSVMAFSLAPRETFGSMITAGIFGGIALLHVFAVMRLFPPPMNGVMHYMVPLFWWFLLPLTMVPLNDKEFVTFQSNYCHPDGLRGNMAGSELADFNAKIKKFCSTHGRYQQQHLRCRSTTGLHLLSDYVRCHSLFLGRGGAAHNDVTSAEYAHRENSVSNTLISF